MQIQQHHLHLKIGVSGGDTTNRTFNIIVKDDGIMGSVVRGMV